MKVLALLIALSTAHAVETLPLPDPLLMADGTKVTSAEEWTSKRRPELLSLFADNIYGRTPLGRPDNLRFLLRQTDDRALDGKATRLRVGILFEGTPDGRQMELLVYLPNHIKAPVPVFFGLNFDGNFTITNEPDIPIPDHYVHGLFSKLKDHRASEDMRGKNAGMWPVETIISRGYGLATACYNEVEPDLPNQWWHGPRVLAAPQDKHDWGAIGGWAWAMSRAADYLETNPRVDKSRIIALGFSRLGKTTMWAGAQDERFAAVVSQHSGKGGISLSKRLTGEPVFHLAGDRLGHWFCENYQKFSNNEKELPVDGNCLAALIAPRPLLILSGSEDSWSDPEGEFLSGQSASAVYQLLGVEGLATDTWPAPGKPVLSRIGCYLYPGGHTITPDHWSVTLDWADKNLN